MPVLPSMRAAVVGDPVGADVDGLRARSRRCRYQLALVTARHGAVVVERDVRGARGLHEGDVGDLVPGLQRRLREELLGRVQPADVVGDGVGGPVMGERAVVLPEAVDQIVGELRDRTRPACAEPPALTLLPAASASGNGSPSSKTRHRLAARVGRNAGVPRHRPSNVRQGLAGIIGKQRSSSSSNWPVSG